MKISKCKCFKKNASLIKYQKSLNKIKINPQNLLKQRNKSIHSSQLLVPKTGPIMTSIAESRGDSNTNLASVLIQVPVIHLGQSPNQQQPQFPRKNPILRDICSTNGNNEDTVGQYQRSPFEISFNENPFNVFYKNKHISYHSLKEVSKIFLRLFFTSRIRLKLRERLCNMCKQLNIILIIFFFPLI